MVTSRHHNKTNAGPRYRDRRSVEKPVWEAADMFKRSRKPPPPTIIPALPGYWWRPNEAAWPKTGPESVRIVAWLVEVPEYGGRRHVELHPLVTDLYTVTDPRHWLDQDADEFGEIVHESDL